MVPPGSNTIPGIIAKENLVRYNLETDIYITR